MEQTNMETHYNGTKRILNMKLTKSQIDHIVNVNGLKAPRSKGQKELDQFMYRKGYKKQGSIQKSIYEIVKQSIK